MTEPDPVSCPDSLRACCHGSGIVPQREALSIRNLSVRFGGITALNDVSMRAGQAGVLGVIGPNGAGKTTLLNTICGVSRRAATGQIVLEGKSILGQRPVQIARAGLRRSFQHPPLIDNETVLENVLVGAHLELRYSLATQVLAPGRVRRAEEQVRVRSLALLDAIGLSKLAAEPVANLPYGSRKLIDIARALISGPRLLLLDEPTSGLDHVEQDRVQTLLLRLRAEGQVTILLVEHHLDIVRAVATEVVGLQAGRVLAYGDPGQVLDSPEFRTAMVGPS